MKMKTVDVKRECATGTMGRRSATDARRETLALLASSGVSVCVSCVVTTHRNDGSSASALRGLIFWCGILMSVLAPLADVAATKKRREDRKKTTTGGGGGGGDENGFRFRSVAASMVGYVVGLVAWCGITWAFGASGWRNADAARGSRALASMASGMTFAPLFVACDAAMEDGCEDVFKETARQARRIAVDGDVRTPREVGARASAFGACVGAWFGALPIPLDWDRAWQKWPVSVVRGMTLGQLVGATMAIVYVYLHDVLRMRASTTMTTAAARDVEDEKEMFPSSPPKRKRGRPRKNPA